MLDKDTLAQIKESLLAEKARLEEELGQFAGKDSDVEGNFNAKWPEYGSHEDDNATEVADYTDRLSLEKELESTLQNVNKALVRIEGGEYGSCEYCGMEIPVQRLLASPMSTACIHCLEERGA